MLADTDVLIDYLAGTEPSAACIRECAASDTLQTSAITCFELLSGAQEGKLGQRVRDLVGAIPVIPLNREAATRAASVRQQLSRSGFSIGMADSLIAGIALANNLPLLTRNRKHFENIEGLRLLQLD